MALTHSDDERRLADLGYKQELHRTWSGFSNFAISFSIISILSGCFTTFAQAWNNGGPVAISLGWPVIAALILVIGLCMSELASAFPTSVESTGGRQNLAELRLVFSLAGLTS
jgi:amino acid transporter